MIIFSAPLEFWRLYEDYIDENYLRCQAPQAVFVEASRCYELGGAFDVIRCSGYSKFAQNFGRRLYGLKITSGFIEALWIRSTDYELGHSLRNA